MVVQIVTMLVQYFLYSLFLTPAALALNVHQNHDQRPLLPIERPQLTNVYSQHASVMLGYTEHGSNQEKAVDIPLNTRVWSGRGLQSCLNARNIMLIMAVGINLPARPKTLRVLMAANGKGQSMPLEKLDSIVCRLEPRLNLRNKAAVTIARGRKPWLEFSFKDGIVGVGESDSLWYLTGIAVAAYECR